MTKKDLKTGHIVETRRGERAVVMRDTALDDDFIVFGTNSWTSLDGFSDDLIWHKEDKSRDYAKTVDIVKIYKTKLGTDCMNYPTFECTSDAFNRELELIWERKEVVEMTIEEIESKLGINNLKVVK